MGLQGNLEDLPLLDIIQIVSFSKKTGYLSIEMEGGDGAIVFQAGLVVSAFTAASPPADPRLGTLAKDARERAVRSRIVFALEQLARLREGAFGFELTDDVPATIGARDITLETLARGINPQEMLLELAQGLDDDRAQSAAAVEASFAAPDEAVLQQQPIVPAAATEADLKDAAPEKPPDVATVPLRPIPRALIEGELAEANTAPGLPLTEAGSPQATAPQGAPSLATAPEATPQVVAAPDADPAEPHSSENAIIPPRLPEPVGAQTILLTDDEPDIRQILGRHFASHGYRIEEAGDPEEAAKAAGRLREAGLPFVLVTDLGMPATGGASFYGGFEVMKRIWKMNLRPPVLMMTESLNESLRLRAKQMGVQSFVFKPTLSKLNPRQYEADLSAFAAKLAQDVLPRLSEAAAIGPQPRSMRSARSAEPGGQDGAPPETGQPYDFLKRRLLELRHGGDANQIAVLVMKVAQEFFERAILFVVKNDEARGLGGFGLAPREETLNLLARQITIPLDQPSLFRDVAHARRAHSGPLPADRWTGHLLGRIGRFQSKGGTLLPLVAHRETIALLFGDNPSSGREPERLAALEVFVEQAGIALENVFLQRKIQSMQGGAGPAPR